MVEAEHEAAGKRTPQAVSWVWTLECLRELPLYHCSPHEALVLAWHLLALEQIREACTSIVKIFTIIE